MEAFDELYRQYFADVHRYVRSLCGSDDLAEEITQETFFKALRGIGGFQGTCSVRVWLCQIAKNTYYSHCKREKTRARHLEDKAAESCPDLEQQLINEQSAFEIHRSLHRLPEPYREVFWLRLFGELPFARIGELFGKTESWARVTYHRARLRIKEDLG